MSAEASMKQAGAAASPTFDALYGKVSRRLLPILILGYIAAYLDRVNVGFAKLQMVPSLHFSQTAYGLGAGLFFIGYFLFEVPSNAFLYRLGARRWLGRIMISWGVVSALTLFVRTPIEFYGLRLLLGLAEAGFFPGVIYYLTQWYPTERRAKVTALFMTGIALCSVIGSLVSGWIMGGLDGAYGWAGWQWLFLLEAVPALVVGVLILNELPDTIASARWLNADEKYLMTTQLDRDAARVSAGTLADAFRDRRVWFGCLIYFCAMTGLYGISFWLPTIIAELGVKSPLRIGLLTAIPYAVAGVGMVLVGKSADTRRERRWHLAVPAALGALGLVASFALAAHPALALAALSLATFGILTSAPIFWSLPTAFLRGAAAAAGIAIINSCGNLAGFLSPYVVGWLKDATGSTASGMYYVASFLLLGALLVLVWQETKRPAESLVERGIDCNG
jgi:D-galactonate transporter